MYTLVVALDLCIVRFRESDENRWGDARLVRWHCGARTPNPQNAEIQKRARLGAHRFDHLYLVRMCEDVRIGVFDVPNSFTKQAVSPTEPRSSEVGGVVDIDTFMHERCTCGCIAERGESVELFLRIGGGEDLHQARHGPSVVCADMRATYAAKVGAAEGPFVGRGREHESTRTLIDDITGVEVAQIR